MGWSREANLKLWAAALVAATLFLGCSGVDTARAQKNTPKVDPKIRSQLNDRGSARVIVRLRVPIESQAVLAEKEELARKHAIAAAQLTFLKKIANTKHRVIRQFEITPDLVLEISADALSLIESSDEVEQIFYDEILSPSR